MQEGMGRDFSLGRDVGDVTLGGDVMLLGGGTGRAVPPDRPRQGAPVRHPRGRQGTCFPPFRNQTHETAISAQSVPGMRFLVFDFAVEVLRNHRLETERWCNRPSWYKCPGKRGFLTSCFWVCADCRRRRRCQRHRVDRSSSDGLDPVSVFLEGARRSAENWPRCQAVQRRTRAGVVFPCEGSRLV
eukprot:904047-Rhodomonas_salina.4